MYSAKVLDHLENPRNAGEIPDATARGEAENPICGDELHLFLRVDSGVIVDASFMARGCPPTLAASSVLTELIKGMRLDEAGRLRPRDVTLALDHLPANKEHCSVLAIDALHAALAGLPSDVV